MAKQADLLPVEEARERILAAFSRLGAESVALDDAVGRILAEDISSPIAVPPFANSSMDGFALRSIDTQRAPAVLPVSAEIAAGSLQQEPLRPGTCARIMTGAPLPPGADAVIPFEEVRERAGEIEIARPVLPGSCVRPAGNDYSPGAELLPAGMALDAPQIALAASAGYAYLPVTRQPRVAILATGDELVAPGQDLSPGQIYNSNSPMLRAAVREAGGQPLVTPAAADDPAAIAGALQQAADADLLITSGGASVGDFDYVKQVVGAAGELGFWRVRVRPGKPLLFGSVNATPVIGLPGNPTSAMVTFELFVRPAIRVMLGAPPLRPEIDAVLDAPLGNRGGRRTYARVAIRYADGAFHAIPSGPQDSAMLLPLARADGLAILDEDCPEYAAGDRVTVQVWRLPPRALSNP